MAESLTGRKKKPAAGGGATLANGGMLSPTGAGGFGAYHAPLADIASGAFLGKTNPWLDEVNAATAEEFKRTALPGISRTAEAQGRYGSNAQGVAQGVATTGLTNVQNQNRYQDYEARMGDLMSALGMGTQRDIAKYGTDAQSAAAANAAAASAASDASMMDYRNRALNQEGELAALGMLGNLTGYQQGGMEQALGMIPGLDSISGYGAYGDLFGGSGDLAQLESQYDLGGREMDFRNRELGVNAGIANRGLGLEASRDQYGREMDAFSYFNQQPWANVGNYADITQGMTSPYGVTDTRGVGARQGPSTAQGALSGALGGFDIGSQIGGMFPQYDRPSYDPRYGIG